MGIDERAQKWRQIKELSDDAIHENLAKKIWNPETEEIAERELRIRENRETLKSLANSAAANEKAAQASEKTSIATSRLVRATWLLVFGTFGMILITVYIGIILPYREKLRNKDLFLWELTHYVTTISAHMKENIRMIEANTRRLAANTVILNSLFELDEPDLSRIVTYVGDTNVEISLNLARGCVEMLNQKISERNRIYERLVINEPVAFNRQLILEKEGAIKTTTENCALHIEKVISQLDQIHTYRVETSIK